MGLVKCLRNRYLILFFLLVFSFIAVHIVRAVTAEPGTDADPIVSQSYVDGKINEVSTLANSLKQQVQNLQEQGVPAFEVVEIKKGQQLLAGASAEIILRSGMAKAIEGQLGGLSDVTAGVDLKTGDNIPLNHLIIVPRDDGRGLVVESDGTFLMVKGKYTIK